MLLELLGGFFDVLGDAVARSEGKEPVQDRADGSVVLDSPTGIRCLGEGGEKIVDDREIEICAGWGRTGRFF